MNEPFLIYQLRPEDTVAENEFEKICRYGGLQASEVVRVRIQHTSLPKIQLENYCGIIVGGSPLDVSIPEDAKTQIQKRKIRL